MRALIVVITLSLAGCAATVSQTCQRGVIGLGAVDAIAIPVLNAKCMSEAKKCSSSHLPDCVPWKECDRVRSEYKTAMDMAGKSFSTINRVAHDFGFEKEQVSK